MSANKDYKIQKNYVMYSIYGRKVMLHIKYKTHKIKYIFLIRIRKDTKR